MRYAVSESAKIYPFWWHLPLKPYKSLISTVVKNQDIPVRNKHLWALSGQSR